VSAAAALLPLWPWLALALAASTNVAVLEARRPPRALRLLSAAVSLAALAGMGWLVL
jgi:hypothetical protein